MPLKISSSFKNSYKTMKNTKRWSKRTRTTISREWMGTRVWVLTKISLTMILLWLMKIFLGRSYGRV